jgi:glycosyltransferase involved in cell wall biosynthesis
MARVGIIARADLTGLGVQSRNWVRLLDPDKTIVINSSPFNGNPQHYEWYKRRNAFRVDGFIQPGEINPILNGLDVILTFEIPYNYGLIRMAKTRGVKTIIQNNWEFTDYLRQPYLPLPDLLVNHSYWHLDDQKKLWPQITEYCATPVFLEDYDSIYEQNLARDGKKRFLHVAGRKTYEDRNGTQDLLKAVKLIPKEIDFELVIKAQTADVPVVEDSRITIDRSQPLDEKELYRDFDAVIMPRRYGGACLPMNESLASGLPVIMTDIDPNNKILPKEWLVKSNSAGSFMTRTMIDVFSADPQALADKIIEFAKLENKQYNIRAREIALKEYSAEAIKEKWALLLQKLGV